MPPTGSSSGLLGRFLLGFGTAFASAVPVEVTSLKILEFAEFVEGDVSDRSNSFPDGLIEFENLPMGAGVQGCEVGQDIFSIFLKFLFTMGEDEFGSPVGNSPRDDPVAMGFD